jgi:hypothetical protein
MRERSAAVTILRGLLDQSHVQGDNVGLRRSDLHQLADENQDLGIFQALCKRVNRLAALAFREFDDQSWFSQEVYSRTTSTPKREPPAVYWRRSRRGHNK